MSDQRTFIELVAHNCREYPENTAVHEGSRKVSYHRLWDFSGRVYAALARQKIGEEDVVMIRTGTVTDTIITMLGVLRAGAAFVIAGNWPQAGLIEYVYADCGCRMLINDEVLGGMLEEKAADGFARVKEHAAAYVIYTSGTTERPKGVKMERGAMTLCSRTLVYQGEPFSTPADRIALLSPLTFTAGIIVVNTSLTGGAQLFAASRETITEPLRLKNFLFENKITRCFMTPSLYKTVHEFNPEMTWIGLSGEKLERAGRKDLLLLNIMDPLSRPLTKKIS